MEAQITPKQEWIRLDYDGIDYIPDDLVDTARVRSIMAIEDDEARVLSYWAIVWPMLRDHAGEQRFSIERYHADDESWIPSTEVITGYGVRLSAPGYLDCTDWEVYTNKAEAIRRARALDRGED